VRPSRSRGREMKAESRSRHDDALGRRLRGGWALEHRLDGLGEFHRRFGNVGRESARFPVARLLPANQPEKIYTEKGVGQVLNTKMTISMAL